MYIFLYRVMFNDNRAQHESIFVVVAMAPIPIIIGPLYPFSALVTN